MKGGSIHIPVMQSEVVNALCMNSPGHYLDCTAGGGGHAEAVLAQNEQNQITACDRDSEALQRLAVKFDGNQRITFRQLSFSQLNDLRGEKFHGVLADLGVSTDQLKGQRGFSFAHDAPLDMRMDPEHHLTAREIVNNWDERSIVVALKEGGVGDEAKLIAKAIIRARPIESSQTLAHVIEKAIGAQHRDKRGHPATVAFQAIRMKVNGEREEIEALLGITPELIHTGGRFVAITFHSIEDKLVTHAMRSWEGEHFSALSPESMARRTRDAKILGRVVSRKAIFPSDAEVARNPSARSARLRVFEFN